MQHHGHEKWNPVRPVTIRLAALAHTAGKRKITAKTCLDARRILHHLFFAPFMARKRSIGICDQTWSALLVAVGGRPVRCAFR